MTHLVYSRGEWRTATPAFSDSPQLGEVVEPKAGDTFSDFTSHKSARKELHERGLSAVVTRTAMWGENDYCIE